MASETSPIWGARLTLLTLVLTTAAALFVVPSLTMSWKTSVAPSRETCGATNVGRRGSVRSKTTTGPLTCVH